MCVASCVCLQNWGGGAFCADNYTKGIKCSGNGNVVLPFGDPVYVGMGFLVFSTIISECSDTHTHTCSTHMLNTHRHAYRLSDGPGTPTTYGARWGEVRV